MSTRRQPPQRPWAPGDGCFPPPGVGGRPFADEASSASSTMGAMPGFDFPPLRAVASPPPDRGPLWGATIGAACGALLGWLVVENPGAFSGLEKIGADYMKSMVGDFEKREARGKAKTPPKKARRPHRHRRVRP